MSIKAKSLSLTLSSFATIVFFYVLALYKDLFFYYWWFDIPMHFLGGFIAGLVSVYYFFIHNQSRVPTERKIFFTAIISAIIIGVVWEIFEYVTKLSFTIGDYRLDIIKDLFVDVYGAIVAYVYYSRQYKFKNE